jgi:hypothetical protein
MSTPIPNPETATGSSVLANGPGAAALLAGAVGCFVLAVLAVLGDKISSIKLGLIFWKPTGPLSGVTTLAVLVWLCTWGALEWRWHNRDVAIKMVTGMSLALLALSLLLVFPPVVDLF